MALEQSKDKKTEDKLLTPSVLPRNDKSKIEDEESQTEEEKFKPKVNELKPFGYELFAGEPTTFTPSENALVPDTLYRRVLATLSV